MIAREVFCITLLKYTFQVIIEDKTVKFETLKYKMSKEETKLLSTAIEVAREECSYLALEEVKDLLKFVNIR